MSIVPSVVISDPSLANGYTVTTPPGGGWLIKPKTGVSTNMSAAEQAIRARWLQHGDHPHEAMTLVEWLRAQGLTVVPPKTRKPGKEDEPYLRWEGVNANNKKVSGYVNTSSLTINGASKVEVVAGIDGVDVRNNGKAAHFFLPDVDLCKTAVETLLNS
jgi:hypothetical protein